MQWNQERQRTPRASKGWFARCAKSPRSAASRSWRIRRSRALHGTVEIDDEMSAEHDQTVAEVIG
jgi:hypothetical protein